jgi:hypothetical protein
MTQSTPKPNKFKAQRTGKYASKAEARRAAELKLLERAGKIQNLGEQVKFEIIPRQDDADGKCLERACHYIADFVYTDPATGQEIVEDCKGFRTPEYRLKKKLMLLGWGIQIKEVA